MSSRTRAINEKIYICLLYIDRGDIIYSKVKFWSIIESNVYWLCNRRENVIQHN